MEERSKLDVLKTAVRWIVLIGTGKIVTDIIQSNTEPEGMRDYVTYTAGGYALGGLVAVEAGKFTDQKIDDMAASWEASKRKNRKKN